MRHTQATVLYSMTGRQIIQGLCGALDTKASQVQACWMLARKEALE